MMIRTPYSIAASSKIVPWWRKQSELLGGIAPGFYIDVLNSRYMLNGARTDLSALLTVTNASVIRTYVDAAGTIQTAAPNTGRISYLSGVPELLLEGAATNLLLNSATAATQNVTTTAQSYTLSFWGSGSVTLSGSATGSKTGSASRRSILTVTASAGTLTLTPSGTVTNWQLESGTGASSWIPTAGSTVTRPTDLIQLTAGAAAVLQGTAAGLAWRGNIASSVANQRLIAIGTATLLRQGGTAQIAYDGRGGASVLSLTPTNTIPGQQGICVGWGSAGRIGQNAGGSVVSDANALTDSLSTVYVGTSGGISAGSILRLRQLVGWSLAARPASASITSQARTV